MYVFVLHEIIIKLRRRVGRRTKTLLNQPVVGYRLFNDMFVCLCITPACVCLRASGWLAGCGCLLAGNSNSCYWDFLRQHVNKRKALEPASACPPANESRAPRLDSANGQEEGGCDSAPRRWGGGAADGGGEERREEKKNGSKAQSFESGSGTDEAHT